MKYHKLAASACLVIALATFAEADTLTLQESLDIAFKNNPQILTSKEKVDIASAKMGQAGSGLLPQISASYSSGKSYVQPMTVTLPPSMGGGTFSTTPNEAADSLSYSATATQTLFAGGRVLQLISTAKAGYDVAGQDYIKAKNEVTFNVISSYFEILKAKKNLLTIEDAISSLQKHLKQTELFYKSGISSRADLLRSQAEIANANVAKISAQMGLELARLTFAANLGTNIGSDFDIQNIETNYFPEKETSAPQLLKTAFANRPDWISYNLGMTVAKDAIAYSYGSYLPVVMYQYSAGKNKTDYKSAAKMFDLDNWRSMIVASWNAFDGFNTANRIREAYAALNTAKAQEQTLKDAINLDVKSSYLSLLGTKQKVEASKIAQELAKKALRLSEISFASNTGSNLSYIEALSAHFKAQTAYWSNIYDLEVAKARINKVTGTAVY